MRIFHSLMIISMGLFLMLGSARADRVSMAEAHVTDMIAAAQVILRDEAISAEDKEAGIRSLMTRYFDIGGITRASAGQYWRKATPAQQERYSELFAEVLKSTAIGQFDQLRTLEFIPTRSTEKGPKMVLVGGRIVDNSGVQPDAIVNWRVATREGKPPSIIDIEIENISLLITQRQENQAIIRKNNGAFQALIDTLESQINTAN